MGLRISSNGKVPIMSRAKSVIRQVLFYFVASTVVVPGFVVVVET